MIVEYNYGDTIDEAGIVAASETVRAAGTLTLFNGGGTAVGTIAVGTTLNSSDFTLQPDGTGGTDVIVSSILGIYLSGVNLLTNPTKLDSTAKVSNSVVDGAGITSPAGTAWTLVNDGKISDTASGGRGIWLAAGGTITNARGGVVAGGVGGESIDLGASGSVTNQSGGTISGGNQGILAEDAAATVLNAGRFRS